MTFTEKLAQAAAAVEAYLIQELSPIEKTTGKNYSFAVPDRLAAAMRHAVLAGGKRFRPFLALQCAALFGVQQSRAMPVAAALECIHCYSLAHDDLPAMDNDELRRGQPSVWKAFDEWTAILAGDALLTLAFELIADRGDLDAATRNVLVRIIAAASGPAGMVGGQCLDLVAEKLEPFTLPNIGHIEHLEAMKTGALIRASCEAGAVIGGADYTFRHALALYGHNLGFAFQIADDLLDAEGDTATVGKATHKDAVKGKATLVSLLGIDAARARLAEAEASAIAALEPFGERADALREAAHFVSHRTS